MATKLYLHDAANALTGTFPTGQQSSLSATHVTNKASTLRTMNTTIGAAQVIASFSSTTTTALQTNFVGFFCSNTLDVDQTVGNSAEKVNFSIANLEASTNMNLGVASSYKLNLYVWRPSTGSIVGRVLKNLAVVATAEPSLGGSERSNNGSTTGTTSPISALAGDVLICEVFQAFTQAAASQFRAEYYYDGTTETTTNNTSVSNHAAFLNFNTSNITFGTPASSTISASFGVTLGAATVGATGNVLITGSKNATLQDATLSANAKEIVTGSFNKTLDDATLSASAKEIVSGLFNVTLDVATVSGQGTVTTVVTSTGALNVTLDSITRAATGSVVVTGRANVTTDDTALAGSAKVLVTGSANLTTDAATVVATGSSPALGTSTGTRNVTLGDASVSGNGRLGLVFRDDSSGHPAKRKKPKPFVIPDPEAQWGKGPDEIFGKPIRPTAITPASQEPQKTTTVLEIISQIEPPKMVYSNAFAKSEPLLRSVKPQIVDDTEETMYMLLAALM